MSHAKRFWLYKHCTLALISFVEKEEPNPSGKITSTDPLSPPSSFEDIPIFRFDWNWRLKSSFFLLLKSVFKIRLYCICPRPQVSKGLIALLSMYVVSCKGPFYGLFYNLQSAKAERERKTKTQQGDGTAVLFAYFYRLIKMGLFGFRIAVKIKLFIKMPHLIRQQTPTSNNSTFSWKSKQTQQNFYFLKVF